MTKINAFFIPPEDGPESAVDGANLIEGMIARVDDLQRTVDSGEASPEQVAALAAGKDILKQWGWPCGTFWFGWHIWACAAQGDRASILRRRLLSSYQMLTPSDSYEAPVFDREKLARMFRLPDDSAGAVLRYMQDPTRCWQMAAWCKKRWLSKGAYVKGMYRVGDSDDDEPETLSALDRACMRRESYDLSDI